ncbi:MAG: metalloregulator ArsR/SmtB family transcription factor [Devosia sp.]|jgi:ArsR family transcriptional regulator, virulence genes transcriptional regulator|nr:metalloregulator ArsR/SmtB family transcription factor [Devosia sp.]
MIKMEPQLLAQRSDAAANLLAAMANQSRLMILCHLLNEELTVGQLAERVGLNQSPLSQHLSKLRALGLVKTRREGQSIHYRLASPEVEAVLQTLYSIYCAV